MFSQLSLVLFVRFSRVFLPLFGVSPSSGTSTRGRLRHTVAQDLAEPPQLRGYQQENVGFCLSVTQKAKPTDNLLRVSRVQKRRITVKRK